MELYVSWLILQYPMICLCLESTILTSPSNICANWGSLKEISNHNIANSINNTRTGSEHECKNLLLGILLPCPFHIPTKNMTYIWYVALIISSSPSITGSKSRIWMELGPANLKGKITFNHVVRDILVKFSIHAKIFVQLVQASLTGKILEMEATQWYLSNILHQQFFKLLKFAPKEHVTCNILYPIYGILCSYIYKIGITCQFSSLYTHFNGY